MGMSFEFSTAVTNRCNLPIMCLHNALLYIKMPLIKSTLHSSLMDELILNMTFLNGYVSIHITMAQETGNSAAYSH